MKKEDLICCYPECEIEPEWRIYFLSDCVENIYDEAHSCMGHVGFLLWSGRNQVEPIEYNMEV